MARRPPRKFLPLALDFVTDDKICALSPQAELVYIRLLLWAKEHPQTDGYIPNGAIAGACQRIPQPRHWIKELTMCSLCTTTKDGYKLGSWGKWNATRDELEIATEGRKRGAQIANHKRGRHRNPVDNCPLCRRYSEVGSDKKLGTLSESLTESLMPRRGREELSNESSLSGALDAPALEGRRSGPASSKQHNKRSQAEQDRIDDANRVPLSFRNW